MPPMAVTLPVQVVRDKPKLLDQVRDVIRRKSLFGADRRGVCGLERKASGHALKIRRFFLMRYVYVLRSTSDGGLYIGIRRICGKDSNSMLKAIHLQPHTADHGS